MVEESPVGSSASNGTIENGIKTVGKQVRTAKLHLEDRIGKPIPVDSDVMPWMIRHSGATLSRYSVGPDGKTAHERLKGRPFSAPVTEFGECVWYRKVKPERLGKINSKWGEGLWLGIRDQSTESLIGTPNGILK